jgi:hypothetical protein
MQRVAVITLIFRPPDPAENELIPITVESRRNSDSALIPAG